MSASIDTLIVGAAPVGGGEAHYRELVTSARRVIAADAGLAVCLGLGRVPDVVVGDFDSAPAEMLDRVREADSAIISHPRDKDASDLDLALECARDTGARTVVLTAAFTGRLDHTLAALGTLTRSADMHGVAREPGFICHALDARLRPHCALELAVDTTLSVFTLSQGSVVSLDGVRWPLRQHPLATLSSLGLSNLASGGVVDIRVHAGSALLFVLRT